MKKIKIIEQTHPRTGLTKNIIVCADCPYEYQPCPNGCVITNKGIKKRGGKRPGSGRPKLKDSEKKESTKVMRIPISKVDKVNKIIKK